MTVKPLNLGREDEMNQCASYLFANLKLKETIVGVPPDVGKEFIDSMRDHGIFRHYQREVP